jgi:hypothetical protein
MKAKEAVALRKPGIFHDKKIFILIGLLLLTAFMIAYQWNITPVVRSTTAVRSPSQPLLTNAGPGRSTSAANPLDTTDSTVIYSELQQNRVEFPGEKRNIFSFYVPPPPPQTLVKVQAPPPPVCGDHACQAGESYQSCPSDCPPPPPPPISLKYIGYLKEKDGAVAFLTDGKEVYMGRVNDIIANKYKVLKITDEGIELGYVNLTTNQSKTIPFEGNVKS